MFCTANQTVGHVMKRCITQDGTYVCSLRTEERRGGKSRLTSRRIIKHVDRDG